MTEHTPTPKQAERTQATIRRIAELRIKALGLNISVDEYLERCKKEGAK